MISDGNSLILPEFRGRRWSTRTNALQFHVARSVGYRGVMGETCVRNQPSYRYMRRLGATPTGSIPRGIYFRDVGWVDLVTFHVSLDGWKWREHIGGILQLDSTEATAEGQLSSKL